MDILLITIKFCGTHITDGVCILS